MKVFTGRSRLPYEELDSPTYLTDIVLFPVLVRSFGSPTATAV